LPEIESSSTLLVHALPFRSAGHAWFSILSRRVIRRGAFTNVRALTAAVQRFLDHWNDDCKPFVFVSVKAADEILATLHRQRSLETVH
jgi:hypothetical protein